MSIGIYDYGIGGINLYKMIENNFKDDIVYFSDSGFTPYGMVPELELKNRVEKVLKFYNDLGIYRVAIACNAASTVKPDTEDVLSVIDFGITMVLDLNLKKVAVVGGGRIVESEIYKKCFEKNGIDTFQKVTQSLSLKIEAGDINSHEMIEEIETMFKPLMRYNYILLACTHYSIIADKINQVVASSTLLDPLEEMTNWIITNWNYPSGNSSVNWVTTGDGEKMKEVTRKLFDIKISNVQQINL